jgi:two-component system, chemotaxis family, protein-glutamate methylesterase/glutaminase
VSSHKPHDFAEILSAPPRDNAGPLDVLVVDDSAIVRQALMAILSEKRGFRVTLAADPLIAMDKMKRFTPDVILLDLEMPRMDGMTFLEKLMSQNPVPVVVCSGLTGPRTEAAIRALEIGAVDIITKPQIGIRGFLEESAVLLEDTVRAAATARVSKFRRLRDRSSKHRPRDLAIPAVLLPASAQQRETIVAIGASTGGTEALLQVLEQMPENCPGIVAVQHMPEGFTAAFAKRLNGVCRIEIKEAADGDKVGLGRAFIAPGNRQTLVRRIGSTYFLEVRDGPLVSRHRPSVNVLFSSVAQAAGSRAIGILMTGMGDDGADGLLEMKQADALTIAQDEASCVVFGMPREAILRGAVHEVLSLSRIPSAILRNSFAPKL